MIIVNNRKFAKNDSEFNKSLFQSGGTCVGFYKTKKNGKVIHFFTPQKELFAAWIHNKYDEKLLVSCILESNKPFYSYARNTFCDKYFGLNELRYVEVEEIVNNIKEN